MAYDHDTGYKLLFSHPQMVRDLLAGFVQGEWLADADFSTLTPVPGSYVSQTDDPEQRHDDLVWKVRLKDRWLYVYLLLEFQSSNDPWMALRILVYVGLLYQDLAKRRELAPDGKLPPVLPIVLYNGQPRWSAPLCVEDLVTTTPAGLEDYIPRCRYLLLDEGRYDTETLNPLRNVVAALFRLETQRNLDDVRGVIDALIEWLAEEEQRSLRRAFAIWIKRLLRGQLPDAALDGINDLYEVKSMLAENIKSWFVEYEERGMAKGMEKGIAKGMEKGIAKGMEKGIAKGIEKGEATIIKRQLLRRFGALPEAIQQQLDTASSTQLEVWAERVLDAKTLADVFH